MSHNDAWMPLYVGDYLADTMHLNAAQHGAYLLLLMNYWRHGPLADDAAQLAATARTEPKVWSRDIWPALRMFFTLESGRWHQKRCDLELSKAEEGSRRGAVSRQADNARLKRWRERRNGAPPFGAAEKHHHPPETPNETRFIHRFETPNETPNETPPETRSKRRVQSHPQSQPEVVREEKESNINNLLMESVSPREAVAAKTRPEIADYDTLHDVPTQAEIEKRRAAFSVIGAEGAHVRRTAEALSAVRPQPPKRSKWEQIEAVTEAPKPTRTRIFHEPIRSPAEQLAVVLGIPIEEAQQRVRGDAA